MIALTVSSMGNENCENHEFLIHNVCYIPRLLYCKHPSTSFFFFFPKEKMLDTSVINLLQLLKVENKAATCKDGLTISFVLYSFTYFIIGT